jgi:hypothetical protein
MLGFIPENSTKQNLDHGKKLLAVCNHGCVQQVHNWWQDPNMYYAFETEEGAKWFGKHGGPTKFMDMVGANAPTVEPPPLHSPYKVQVECHSCMKPFTSLTKTIPIKVYRCMCGTKIVHPQCFMPSECPICRIKASVFQREQSILSCI